MAQEEDDKLTATAILSSAGANLPALFSNRFYIVANPATTRIVFSEVVGGETFHHTAIMMPTQDAAELAALLSDLIQKVSAPAKKQGTPNG